MGKTIELEAADGHRLGAYLAQPAGKPRGLLIVMQEVFGVNSHIRSVADGYAADGYLAIAPAAFDRIQRNYESGYTPPEIAAGVQIMKQLDWDLAMLDAGAALAYGATAGKAGMVGYCWGGTASWLAAARLPGLDAACCYYGGSIPNFIDEQPRCPVMLHFGNDDKSLPLDKAQAVAARYPQAQAHYYAAGHGFNCEQRGSFDQAAATQARARTLEFLRQHIG